MRLLAQVVLFMLSFYSHNYVVYVLLQWYVVNKYAPWSAYKQLRMHNFPELIFFSALYINYIISRNHS